MAAAETLTQLASAMATDLRHQAARILGNLMAAEMAEADRARPGPSSSSNQAVMGVQEPGDRPGRAVDREPEEDTAGAGDHGDSDKENAAPEGDE